MPTPTYPLSPSEIEIILHVRWDGSTYSLSERAGKSAVSLTGEELVRHAVQAPFSIVSASPSDRSVEYAIAGHEDLIAMLPRAHRVQLVTTSSGELPPELSGSDWNAGKKGVAKPDGVGILLTRPFD